MELFANVYEGYEKSSMRFQGRRLLILGSIEDDIKKLTFELNYEGDEEGTKRPSSENSHCNDLQT